MFKIGFDNEKYLQMQSDKIRERIGQFGGKLYLEFGGKLFDDYHASRVLPGFAPDSKVKMLLQMKDSAEIVIVISADAIEKNKRDRMILSGPEYLDFGVLNRLILKVMPQKQYRTAHEKYMPAWALRFMGQTEQGMQTMLRRIPDHISLESVRATWEAGLYLYRTDFLVQPDAKVTCWYGEKEGHMKKAIQRLRKAYPSLIVRCFPGFGHGEIINHPALLVSEMEHFLADGETVADAQQNQESEIQ